MRTGHRVLLAFVAASLVLGGCIGASPTPSATSTASESSSPTPSVEPTALPSPAISATPVPSPTVEPTPTAVPSPTGAAFVTYTVRAGDTLGRIAAAHDTTWQSLVYWNRDLHASLDPDDPSYDPNYLAIGWAIRLIPGVVVPFDAPLPTARPTPTPAPAATGTLVTNGSRTTSRVALTFDMGGRVGDALAIMTWLRDHDVKATVFMTGEMADSSATDAGRQVLARIDARPDLFDLGNHTYSHPHTTALTKAQMQAELTSAEAAIDRHASSSPRPLFRPPFGEWNTTLVNAAAGVGYRFTVLWDVDTIDWNPISEGGPTAEQIVDKVLDRAQGGSIVLMHLGGYETLDALPGIVSGLRADGFQFVTLGEMLGG